MAIQLPPGFAQLLAKMGVAQEGAEGEAHGLKGEKKTGKGELLGEDGGLLAGLGYSGKDKKAATKNATEHDNIARFLQDPEEALKALKKEAESTQAETKEGRTTKDGGEPKQEARQKEKEEPAKTAPERTREERNEEQRGQASAQENQPAREQREPQAEAQPKHRERSEDEDDRNKAAGGWAYDDGDDDDGQDRRGKHRAEVFSDVDRCHAFLTDGARCLRKPARGSRYCLAHRGQS